MKKICYSYTVKQLYTEIHYFFYLTFFPVFFFIPSASDRFYLSALLTLRQGSKLALFLSSPLVKEVPLKKAATGNSVSKSINNTKKTLSFISIYCNCLKALTLN